MRIENIYKHIDELNLILKDKFYDEKYKYLFWDGYFEPINLDIKTWSNDGIVILDNDKIVGYLYLHIIRPTNILHICGMALFENNNKHKILLYKYIISYINKTLKERYYSKITFSVIIGNKIEKAYDNFIENFNGRIVGIEEKQTILNNGNFCDVKKYEIINKNYHNIKD